MVGFGLRVVVAKTGKTIHSKIVYGATPTKSDCGNAS
jgi:hypothetical protein